MSVAKDALKLAVAVTNSASVTNPASNEELKSSNAFMSVAKDALNAVGEPEMVAAVNERINVAFAPNDPDILSAICAELEIVPAATTPVNPDPSPVKEPEYDPVNATSALFEYIKFASLASWDILLPDTIIFFQVAMLCNYLVSRLL